MNINHKCWFKVRSKYRLSNCGRGNWNISWTHGYIYGNLKSREFLSIIKDSNRISDCKKEFHGLF